MRSSMTRQLEDKLINFGVDHERNAARCQYKGDIPGSPWACYEHHSPVKHSPSNEERTADGSEKRCLRSRPPHITSTWGPLRGGTVP